MIENVYWSSCKVSVIFVRFEWNFNFLDGSSKNSRTSYLTKMCPVGAELFQAKRQMERHDKDNMTKTIVAFFNFPNAPKKQIS
jgi:hypothetical protein